MPGIDQENPKWIEKDRRQLGRRYRVAAEVRFCWQTSNGWRSGAGITRDLSGYGVSVISSAVPVPGNAIEMIVHFPVSWTPSAYLHSRGEVLRLQPELGQPWGFAASLRFDEETFDGTTEQEGAARLFSAGAQTNQRGSSSS
jgi:hypothetical protein